MSAGDRLRLSDGALWCIAFLIACVTYCAGFAMDRLLPEPSVECVKAGGTWSHVGGGYCERAGK